jgi:trigger factor
MNVSFEKQGNTLATLKVNLLEADYQPAVDKKLKEYRKTAHFKGFRPGMVPLEMVKRLYGKSVLVEEINTLLSKTVSDYIKDNKLDLVGDPKPSREDADKIDWDTQKEFTFTYNVGLAGPFEVDFDKIPAVESFEMNATDEDYNRTLEDLKKRFAEHIHGETVEDNDMVYGLITQGEWVEKTAIPLDKAIKEDQKKVFIGAAKGSSVTFDIQSVFTDTKALALATGKKEEDAASLSGEVSFEIEDITRTSPAELNQAFFDKVLGPEKATDEASFKSQLTDIINDNYKRETEYLLKLDAEKAVLENVSIELPEEFLMDYLVEINEGKFTREDIEKDLDNVRKDIRWSLIKNKIADAEGIKVDYPEVIEKTKEMVRQQFGQFGGGDEMEDVITKVANNYLTEKAKDGTDRFTQMFNAVYTEKIQNVLAEKVKVNKKTITAEAFKELVEAR